MGHAGFISSTVEPVPASAPVPVLLLVLALAVDVVIVAAVVAVFAAVVVVLGVVAVAKIGGNLAQITALNSRHTAVVVVVVVVAAMAAPPATATSVATWGRARSDTIHCRIDAERLAASMISHSQV